MGWSFCGGSFTTGAQWDAVETRNACGEVESSPVSSAIENLTHVDVDDGLDIATTLNALTQDAEILVEQDILCGYLVLSRINSAKSQNPKVR